MIVLSIAFLVLSSVLVTIISTGYVIYLLEMVELTGAKPKYYLLTIFASAGYLLAYFAAFVVIPFLASLN